jgi:glucose/mannose-6-phosphate isomerase
LTSDPGSVLDAPQRFDAVDASDALGDVEGTALQWAAAAKVAVPALRLEAFDRVCVLGMGGSGITGDALAAVAAERLLMPVVTHKGYGLPVWAGRGTLVVVVSYSGDTEETLSGAQVAADRGCPMLTVASGGALTELADTHALAHIAIPGGGMPRHNLGWLLVPVLRALELDAGLDEAVALLEALAREWGRDVPTAANPAKALAALVAEGVMPVVYGGSPLTAVAAARAKAQFNENAKLPASHAAVPELCHNEVVGWESEEGDPASHLPAGCSAGVIWLRDPAGEHHRTALRIQLLEPLLAPSVAWQRSHTASGTSSLARLASLLLFVDLVSVYTALARGVDPTPIASITRLKQALTTQGV